MVLVLMGVSGSGKTTVGKILADQLGWTFLEADEFHPAANVEKMHTGTPLTDADRRPWLDALRERIDRACESGENVVLACSRSSTPTRIISSATTPPASSTCTCTATKT